MRTSARAGKVQRACACGAVAQRGEVVYSFVVHMRGMSVPVNGGTNVLSMRRPARPRLRHGGALDLNDFDG